MTFTSELRSFSIDTSSSAAGKKAVPFHRRIELRKAGNYNSSSANDKVGSLYKRCSERKRTVVFSGLWTLTIHSIMLNMLMLAKMRINQVAEWINLKSIFAHERNLC